MNPKLLKLFNKIENQKDHVFNMIKDLSPEQLNQSPGKGKWSISHIVSHLIVAERLSVQYMQKKIQGVESTKDSGLREEIKMAVLKISQRIDGLKFRAPKYVMDHTVVYSDIDTMKEEWTKTREDFRQLLEKVEDKHIHRLIYKHAVAGYLNVQHAVMFFREHVTHHTPQIKRIVKSLR